MSIHISSAEDMLRHLKQEYQELKFLYSESEKYLNISTNLRIKSYQYLMNCRSVFEYCTQEVSLLIGNNSRKVYFPIIRPPKKAPEFSTSMNSWFPTLESNHSVLFKIFERFQYYNSNSWILALADITNESKHVALSFQETDDCEALVIMSPFKSSIQLGDRGLSSISIGEGGCLQFSQPFGPPLKIKGPQTLTINTTSLHNADPGIILIKQKWKEIKFDKYREQPAIVLLAKSAKEAHIFYKEIAKYVGISIPNDLVQQFESS